MIDTRVVETRDPVNYDYTGNSFQGPRYFSATMSPCSMYGNTTKAEQAAEKAEMDAVRAAARSTA